MGLSVFLIDADSDVHSSLFVSPYSGKPTHINLLLSAAQKRLGAAMKPAKKVPSTVATQKVRYLSGRTNSG